MKRKWLSALKPECTRSNIIYLDINLVNVKNDSLVAKFIKSRNPFLNISLNEFRSFWKVFFTQISILSSNRILVNKASKSKLAISLSWVNSFRVISDRISHFCYLVYRDTNCWKKGSEWWQSIFEWFMHFSWSITNWS